jgi:probable F420-dependent oxidoreductase
MARPHIPVGVVFPQTEIGEDPGAFRDFAQAAEHLGFSHIVAYDHVLGADLTNRPDWHMPYSIDSMFQEPLTLFSYLAGVTSTIGLNTGIIILPQRQVVLFAKQAATLDIVSGGRLRTALGLGWNTVEYAALGVPFDNRADRLDDQIRLLRRLWTERSLTDSGPDYDIVEAGLWPLPRQRPIPIWIGGFSKAAMRRAARIGDGWFPVVAAERAAETIGVFREAIVAEGRDPAGVRLENLIFCCHYDSTDRRSLDAVAADVFTWQKEGADSVCIDTMRMGARGGAAHLDLLRRIAGEIGL